MKNQQNINENTKYPLYDHKDIQAKITELEAKDNNQSKDHLEFLYDVHDWLGAVDN